jgi:nitrogen regulatory protein P-II 1
LCGEGIPDVWNQSTLKGRNEFRSTLCPVKEIVAVVKPFLAEKVLDRLKRAPLEAVTVREVKGYGRQKSYLDEYGDSEYSMAFLPKVEIAVWVDDARVDEIVRMIVEVARTGRMGDGKIMVMPVHAFENIAEGTAAVPLLDRAK